MTIFYHRQTNRHSYSRQACAERLSRTPDGGFLQAEVTSCGLNGGPMKQDGEYPARIACCLWSKHGTARYDKPFRKAEHPFFTQDKPDDDKTSIQYIANMRDGAVAGFRYFDIRSVQHIRLVIGGTCRGTVEVSSTPDFTDIVAAIPVEAHRSILNVHGILSLPQGVHALFFRFAGEGAMDFYAFEMS